MLACHNHLNRDHQGHQIRLSGHLSTSCGDAWRDESSQGVEDDHATGGDSPSSAPYQTDRRVSPTLGDEPAPRSSEWSVQKSTKYKLKVYWKRESSYSRINISTTQGRDSHFETASRILCEADFVAGTAPGHVDSVCLPQERRDGTRVAPNRFTVIRETGAVDIEASQNLCRGTVEPKDDLYRPIRVLTMDR